jgi:hypothetical protein
MKLSLILAAALATGSAALAAPITGSIGFTGAYSASNPAALTAANTLTFGTVTVTGAHDGSFSGIATGTVAATPTSITVNGAGDAVAITGGFAIPIWSVGGFALNLSSIFENPGNTLDSITVKGTGTLTGGGLDPTVGIWIGTFNSAGTNFTFSASSAAVPDGGSTAAFLGLALLGMFYYFKRKVA